MQVQRVQFNNPFITFKGESKINNLQNIQSQSDRQGWEKLKTLLSKPNGSDMVEHPINYKYEETITNTNCLPTFNKKHFEYTDYQNLSPKERRIIGILNRKGTFKLDDSCNFTRDNMSINRDAERILRIALKTKNKLDKEYKNGYKLVGIGRSPAVIVETMHLLGADAVAVPFSQSARYPQKTYCGYGQYYTRYEEFKAKDWEEYFKYFGVDNEFSKRTGKTLIFTDYVCDGGTKYYLESILKGLGFDEKNTKFTEIMDLMPQKGVLLPDDYICLGRCFDRRVFCEYGKIESIARILHKVNVIKNPECLESVPETFLSKLFRCAIYDLIKEKKLKMFI